MTPAEIATALDIALADYDAIPIAAPLRVDAVIGLARMAMVALRVVSQPPSGAAPDLREALASVRGDNPDAIVLDGNDDEWVRVSDLRAALAASAPPVPAPEEA